LGTPNGSVSVGSRSTNASSYVGECFVHVLEGTIEIAFDTADDEPPIRLAAGDSAYYATERRHFLRNVGDGQARTLGVLTPPAF